MVTSCDIVFSASAPPPNSIATLNTAPGTFYVTLALLSGGTVFQVANTILTASPKVATVVQRPPPSPGEEPFTRYWTWNVFAGGGA